VNIVTRLIKDDRIEVREKAGKVLGGMLHCSFISADAASKLMDKFKLEVSKKIKKKPKENEDPNLFQANQSKAILVRHSGVLGLSAFVSSSPYDIPEHLPATLMVLADHLHDPQPIPATVKNVFQEFKRTHQDNWAEHKQKLTEDQLATLTDLLVSPSYYA
jgi:proteasome activator subunit 4